MAGKTKRYPDDPVTYSRLSFADHDKSPKFCAFCAEFQIESAAEDAEEEERSLLYTLNATHTLHQQYEDVYPNFPNFKQRATDGCTFCAFVGASVVAEHHKQAIQQTLDGKLVKVILTASLHEMVEDGDAISMYRKQEPHKIEVEVRAGKNGSNITMFKYTISFQMTSEATTASKEPLSAPNIDRIKEWIQKCDIEHSSCRAALTDYNPTRLLAIEDELIRLVEGGPGISRYAALTYCWGADPNEKSITTNKNYTSRLSGFPIDQLSQTLQDAIRVARTLGIRHIWIDAICIIQDNVQDWTTEAANMADIYNHACLTIAAANSKSSFDGFLQDRAPSYSTSLSYALDELPPPLFKAHLKEIGMIYFRYPLETSIEDHLSECTWNKRGWTLQEKLLSTRTLYFTTDVFYFECITSQNAENSSYKLPDRQDFPVIVAMSKQLSDVEKTRMRSEYLSTWYRAVDDYSMRKLSKLKDKLPAMQGLAQIMSNLVDDVYVYGLWKSDLYRGLLWIAIGGKPSQDYRAPSWSWASKDAIIRWDVSTLGPGWTSLVQFVDIPDHQRISLGDQTQNAQLTLIAPVASLKDVLVTFEGSRFDMDPDDWTEVDSWDFLDEHGCFEVDHDDLPLPFEGTEIMLIAEKAETKNFQALLIRHCGKPNTFRRVGRFILKHNDGGNTEFSWSDRDLGVVRHLFETEKRILI